MLNFIIFDLPKLKLVDNMEQYMQNENLIAMSCAATLKKAVT